MKLPSLIVGLLLAIAAPAAPDTGPAPPAVRLDPPSGAGSAAFRQALKESGLETEGTWYDPDGPAPALAPDTDPAEGSEVFDSLDALGPVMRWVLVGVAGAVLLGLLALAVVHGGGRVAARRPQADGRPRGTATAAGPAPAPQGSVSSLSDILALDDRREALSRLFALVLAHAAAAEGRRVGRGETARDVLRALPAERAATRDLAELLRTQESVRFGGRDVPPGVLEACAERARRILGPATGPMA
ncbi:DUF4129 domain-containing protein [Paroceanicella profunda]|uniref:DUF4129 domain-containing protein n=1 Tax=Paroceanicella profunda TaxID=2579971 RepID=A0A5B8FUU4_9RHOB|nr:DUF4129 domain-containing protein [Paroceanicella profunda]QDL91054.1 DUF4129 domain-containing protein [Paroceanicella profunda]